MEFENKIIYSDYEPPCERRGCFAYENGRCTILTSNDFGKRECPFYKPENENNEV
ncbi:MAG: hypothetical protein K2N56_11230 [Oscillospiraceae bacterium]|nr:hypothetical protein [Oscillospiraceae bacterium]